MRRIRVICALVASASYIAGSSAEAVVARFQFDLNGDVQNVDVRLFDAATPLHVENLIKYIDADSYDGTFIHRNAKTLEGDDFVIQGGGYRILSSLIAQPPGSGWEEIADFGAVQNEPGISNLRGTLALAKTNAGVSTGTSEWFFNLNDDNAFLDQPPPTSNAFTVFGRVLHDGMDVVDEISALETFDASGSGDPFTDLPVIDPIKVLVQAAVYNEDVPVVADVFLLTSPEGDYNFDNVVDLADLTLWESDLGSTLNVEADGDGSAVVEGTDFLVWQRTFTAGSAAASIPEPSSAAIALSATAMILAAARRQARSRAA